MKSFLIFSTLFPLLFNVVCAQNLLGGKTCELSPKPNYRLCTDPMDAQQLTDGKKSSGQFWNKPSTVGWMQEEFCEMMFDLGKVQPISGASFSTAAGLGNVDWPAAVWVLVSDDNKLWYPAGDLVSDLPPKASGGVQKHTFKSKRFRSFGRYVKFLVVTKGSCSFADELEVYRGDDDCLKTSRGKPIDPATFSRQAKIHGFLCGQLRADLDAVASDLSSIRNPAGETLKREWQALKKLVGGLPPLVPDDFQAVFPMNTLERDILRLQANVWAAQRKSPVRLWKSHRWAKLSPSDEPENAKAFSLEVHLAAGEVRSETINLNLALPREVGVTLWLDGFSPEITKRVEIDRVLHTGSRLGNTVCSALQPLQTDGARFGVKLDPGMAHQFWIRVRSGNTKPGIYRGRLFVLVGKDRRGSVPLTIVVYPAYKAGKTFYVCGWDYTNRPTYDLTEATIPKAINLLRDAGVNMPWATRTAMPRGTFAGLEFSEPPDTREFDQWVKRWPDAGRYAIYLAVSKSTIKTAGFGGSPAGTKGFEERLKAWTKFWSKHVRTLGIPPEKIVLHLCDEPRSLEQFEAIEAWSKIIKQAEPAFVLMNTPRPERFKTELVDEMNSIDLLLPNRSELNTGKLKYRSYFTAKQAKGTEVGLYACRDPVRKFDPWFFFGAHFWHCYQQGGTTGGFWAFSDSSGSKNLNEYDARTRGPYTPLFLAGDNVLSSKYLEAIREGVQDARLFSACDLATDDTGLEKALELSTLEHWHWNNKTSYDGLDTFRKAMFRRAVKRADSKRSP